MTLESTRTIGRRVGRCCARGLALAVVCSVVALGSVAPAKEASDHPTAEWHDVRTDCRLANSSRSVEGRLTERSDGRITWEARPGDRLRCDGERFEPLDRACSATDCAAGPREIAREPARRVVVQLPAGWSAWTVEWRAFGARGASSELLAQRTVPAGGPVTLSVASSDDRLLRFRPVDESSGTPSAPQTLYVSAERPGEGTPHRTVEPPRPGVEVLAFVEVGDPAPDSIALVEGASPAPRLLPPPGDFGRISRSGVRPGTVRLRATYADGGVVDSPRRTARPGTTAEWLPWRVPESPQPDDAAAGRWLTGIVRLAGQPVPDLRLRLDPETRAGADEPGADEPRADEPVAPSPEAFTDASGRYRLDLPLGIAGTRGAEETTFRLELLAADGFPILERDAVRLRAEGETVLDLDLGASGLWITVVRADGQPLDEPVTIELRRAGDDALLRSGVIDPASATASEPADDRLTTLLADLEPSNYDVSAFTASGWATLERTTAELAKSAPLGSLELILDRQAARVVITDATGRGVDGLRVALDQREIFPAPASPTVYPLPGASAASVVRIQPPSAYAPVCRRLSAEVLEGRALEIVLQPAGHEAVLIPPKDAPPPPGGFPGVIEGLPGSDCPVPVIWMWQPFRDEHGRERIRIDGLPAGTYRFVGASGSAVLEVPGPPVALVAGP